MKYLGAVPFILFGNVGTAAIGLSFAGGPYAPALLIGGVVLTLVSGAGLFVIVYRWWLG